MCYVFKSFYFAKLMIETTVVTCFISCVFVHSGKCTRQCTREQVYVMIIVIFPRFLLNQSRGQLAVEVSFLIFLDQNTNFLLTLQEKYKGNFFLIIATKTKMS